MVAHSRYHVSAASLREAGYIPYEGLLYWSSKRAMIACGGYYQAWDFLKGGRDYTTPYTIELL